MTTSKASGAAASTTSSAGEAGRPRLISVRNAGRTRSTSARRRRRSSSIVLLLGLLATGVMWTVLAPGGNATETPDANEAVRQGRALFLQGCASCHGLNAQGSTEGPSLVGVGAAAVDFQMSTGRMPLAAPAAQADRKPPSYSETQIDQIAAYVQTLGGGTEVPELTEADLNDADLAEGGELFLANCAQCHQAAGAGAPLTYGKFAPSLSQSTPEQVVEAMRTGPESMPVFGPGQVNDEEAVAVAAYVRHLQDTPAPGGSSIGKYGPVPEGLVAWVIGIGALLGVCLWIGARQKL